MELTQEYIKSILHYDPETGIFSWRQSSGKARRGSVAGSLDADGYRVIPLFHYFSKMKKAKLHRAGRLAILYSCGSLNEDAVVDHINRDVDDNRITNLRVCTNAENARNRKNTGGKSRSKGVSPHTTVFRASICKNGKIHRLGCFLTEQEAAMAYDSAAVILHGQFACTNKDLGLL